MGYDGATEFYGNPDSTVLLVAIFFAIKSRRSREPPRADLEDLLRVLRQVFYL